MTQTSRKYLTFFAVLLAVAIAGLLGNNYLEGVRAEVNTRKQAAPDRKAQQTYKVPSPSQKPIN